MPWNAIELMLNVAIGAMAIVFGLLLAAIAITAVVGTAYLLVRALVFVWRVFWRWREYRRAYWDRHDPGRPKWRNES